LNCDPAGLLRKVQRLAQDHDFLQKVRGKWSLTENAKGLLVWTQESIQSQKRVLLAEKFVRIASTAWFAERVLIPELSHLARYLPDRPNVHLSVPGRGFERALLEGDCDFVVACHPPENPAIAHKQILKEPWSVVCSRSALGRKRPSRTTLSDLQEIPFVRHHEVNPTALIPEELPFEIQFSLSIDNLVGVRSAVLHGLGWSFVPTALVSDELAGRKLEQIADRFELDRRICIWWVRGSPEGKKRHLNLSNWVRSACLKI
jgi:DNA-binding transcriptional LysR family regulator